MPRPRRSRGQAAVELVAVLPLVALAAFVVWRVAVVATSTLQARSAARAGARAAEVGHDPARAARAVLPPSLAVRSRVEVADGRVRVRIAVPAGAPVGPGDVVVGAEAREAGR